jgi:mannose-6-phosphate isomerase-like protein (cupin superfamily)
MTKQGFPSSKTMMGKLGIGQDEIYNYSTTHHDASMKTYFFMKGVGTYVIGNECRTDLNL